MRLGDRRGGSQKTTLPRSDTSSESTGVGPGGPVNLRVATGRIHKPNSVTQLNSPWVSSRRESMVLAEVLIREYEKVADGGPRRPQNKRPPEVEDLRSSRPLTHRNPFGEEKRLEVKGVGSFRHRLCSYRVSTRHGAPAHSKFMHLL